MNSFHRVENISFSDDSISLIIDGEMHTFKLKDISMKLLNAPNDKKLLFDISPSGYGIHWPLLDEDISIDGLLGIKHSKPDNKKVS